MQRHFSLEQNSHRNNFIVESLANTLSAAGLNMVSRAAILSIELRLNGSCGSVSHQRNQDCILA